MLTKSTSHPFALFGPPGTGKTTTVVEGIFQVWKAFRGDVHNPLLIIVAAHSNTAIDLIVKSLLERVPTDEIVRLVSMAHFDNLHPSIRPIAMRKVEKLTAFKLRTIKIICGTLDKLGQLRKLSRNVKSSHMFIDEAGQATEADIVQIWPKYLKDSGQLILAGDPHQLGPVVKSKAARCLGLHRSLLERLLSNVDFYQKNANNNYNDKFVIQLVQNYRSSPQLLKVPNELFYDNSLVACANAAEDILALCRSILPNPDFPMIFHQAYGEKTILPEMNESPSLRNHDEVNIVMKYVNLLVRELKIPKDDIGIISPYRGQIDSIKKRLVKEGLCPPDRLGQKGTATNSIRLGTVETFQGDERKIIILSMVRSQDFTNSLGFLDSRFHGHQRFNVAVTRAKSLLIVVGDKRLLKRDKNWRTLIQYCKNNQSVLKR